MPTFDEAIRDQVEARVTALKLELGKCEKLLAALDEVAPASKPKPTKAATTPVTKVKKPTPESPPVVEEVTESEAEAEAKATTNGGSSNLKQQIEHLLDEGLKPKEIVEITGAKIAYVYGIKRQHSPGR